MVILISLDTSVVGLLVYGYINITEYICCRAISPWLYTADVSSDINITMD
jgi:hypothetical protein